MKTPFSALAFLLSFVAVTAVASPTWYTGSYDPATWQPAAVNVLHGIEAYTGPTMYTGDNHGNTATTTIPLTDGAVPGANINIADIVGVKSGDLKWNFAGPANLSEVRIYSRWFDGGRDGIHIKKVAYKVLNGDNSWIELAGDNNRVRYGLDDNNTSGALYATLKEPDGSFLCTDAIALYIQFSGAQDNDGTGYVEIEAVSESAAPTISCAPSVTRVSATLAGAIPSCGTTATSVTLSYAVAPHGEPLPAYTAYGASLTRGDTFSIPVSGLRWDTEYDYSLYAVNNEGEETFLSGTFRTKAESYGLPPTDSANCGLWEVRIDGNGHDWTPDAWAIETGTGVNQRHRELGAEMAYSTSSHTSTINNQTYSWANNAVFAYVGYIYIQDHTDYIFESSIDDYAYLKIGDVVVKDSPGYSSRHRSTWTSGDAGWYPVDLRLGDTGGGYGPMNAANEGFIFSTDGGTTWRQFMDPGDGTLLRTTLTPPLTILSAANTGSELRLEVSIPPVFAGCPLTACTGATYGAEDPTAWTTAALPPVGADETYRSFSLPYPAGTEYVRLYVTLDGANYWSGTIAIADYEAVDPAAPSISSVSVDSCSADSAVLSVGVVSPGDGFSVCDISIAYGLAPESLTKTQVFSGKTTGIATLPLTGLLPNRIYYIVATASNASATNNPSAVVSFHTASAVSHATGYVPASWPGLWQAVFTNDTSDYLATDKYSPGTADAVNRELGAEMAYVGNVRSPTTHTATLDGNNTVYSWARNRTYAYYGYVYLEAKPYSFASYVRDYSFLKIGETTLISFHNGYDVPSAWLSPEAPGWFPIEIRVSGADNDDVMGDGDEYGTRTIGVGYSSEPDRYAYITGLNHRPLSINSFPNAGWSHFLDPGDGSFLRTAAPLRSITIDRFSVAGGTLDADLSFGNEMPGTYPLRIAYGTTDAGDDPADWDATADVATIPSNSDTYNYTGLTGEAGTTVTAVRFYLVGEGGIRWSDVLYLPDPADVSLSPELAVDARLGDTLFVSGYLASAGATATADVTVYVAETEDMADAVAWPAGAIASGGDFQITAHDPDTSSPRYIQPGSVYYVSVVATNAVGGVDSLPPVRVETPAGADLSDTLSASADMWTATFNGSLPTFGAGDTTTVTLWTGPSADALTNTASAVLTGPGPVSFPNITFPELGTVYYQFQSSNDCATAVWADATPVASVSLRDSTTYIWKSDVLSGDWSDPANWVNSLGDPRLSFPNSELCTASFAECAANTTVNVALDGTYAVGNLTLNVGNLTLVFQGEGQETSRLTVGAGNGATLILAAGESVVFDAAYVRVYNISFANDSLLRLQNEAYLYSYTESSLGARDDTIEVAEGSTFYIHNYLLRMNGTRPTVRLDNGSLSMRGNFAPNSNSQAVGALVEFSGTAPYLAPNSVYPSEQQNPIENAEPPLFRFVIPAEGFAAGERIKTNGSFPATERLPIRFEVARNSDWFQGGSPGTFRLVKAGSILTNMVDVSNQPRPDHTRYFYTYGSSDSLEDDGKAPTGLWVEVKGLGATVLLFR